MTGDKHLNPLELNELLDTVFILNKPIIDKLLYCGTYLLVGPPKIGKSFFVIQLGYHVASGTKLWGLDVSKRKVLYLSLEDTFARLQQRYTTMFGVETDSMEDNFLFATEASFLGDGLISELEKFILKNPNIGLIIVDTLQKVRQVSEVISSYSADYTALSSFKQLSDKYNICILIVHHTRKMEATDAFETISGTNGLLGAADGALVIQKSKRIENKATINIVGRDQPDLQIAVEFDREKLQWNLSQEDLAVNQCIPDPILEKIDKFIVDEWSGTATELLRELDIKDMAPNSLTRKMNVQSSTLLNSYKISYTNKHGKERIITLLRLGSDDTDDINPPSTVP